MKTSKTPRPPCRNATETAAMIGYKNAPSLWAAVVAGNFPRPSWHSPATGGNGPMSLGRAWWTLDVINAELLKRGKKHA